jgi:hypothetical protein
MENNDFINVELFIRGPDFHIIEPIADKWADEFDCYSIINCGYHSAYIFEDFNVIYKLKHYKNTYLPILAENLPENAYVLNITDWNGNIIYTAGKYNIDRDNSKIVHHRYN